jgi:hypothetical protein
LNPAMTVRQALQLLRTFEETLPAGVSQIFT